jgi:hypothetical protein
MRRPASYLILLAGLASPAFAELTDIPLRNWTVPPYRSSGITTMVDQTPPRAFIGLQPCRLLDTRPPANNPLDGDGVFAANETRAYTIPPHCGIPAGVDAVSLNMTATNTGAHPFGHLKVWPVGQAEPNVSTLNWSGGGQTVANAAIVPLSAGGALNVKSGNIGSDVILDINGYFADAPANQSNYLELRNNFPGGPTAFFVNSSTADNSSGVYGAAGGGAATPLYPAAGVYGESPFLGILGVSFSRGIVGSLMSMPTPFSSEIAFGALGYKVDIPDPAILNLDVGVFGQTNSAAAQVAGVIGYAPAGSGAIAGVRGLTGSPSPGAAGVRGQDGGGAVGNPNDLHAEFPFRASAGVRGESHGHNGVFGLTHLGVGVIGEGIGANGFVNAYGYLGRGGAGNLAVYAGGSLEASGSKSFVDPHPTDASKVIRYYSLEGPESGTYFRGRGKFDRGIARIEVPEDFRMVTDDSGLTVQVTPIGGMASVGVLKVDLNEIVVQSSRNLEFYYLVQGVRATHRDLTPFGRGDEFIPESADARLPLWLSEGQKRLLIQNGTYNADGTVNMETARRLGWDRIWEESARPAPQSAEP